MALHKQPANISFAQALNTKTDKWQIPTGQFSRLTNTEFDKQGLLSKRSGYQLLATAPVGAQTISKLNNGIVALGNTAQSYSTETGLLTNAGLFQPMTIDTATMVRRATSQLTCDTAVAANGLSCTTWLDNNGSSYYQVSDSETGQIIIPAVALPATATSCRVYVLGLYFIVTYLATISATVHLQYVAIPIANPAAPLAAVDLSTTVLALTSPVDGQIFNNRLYFAYAASDAGGAVRTGILDTALNRPAAAVITSTQATAISINADASNNNIWVSYYAGTSISATIYNQGLILVRSATVISSGITAGVAELTSSVANGLLTVVYEVNNTYTFAPNAKTDYLAKNTLTQSGTAGTASVLLRGVGLASRAIISNFSGQIVFLATYGQTYQPTYLLVDIRGNVLARLAYSNGAGYIVGNVLPNINQVGNMIQVAYLYADQLIPVNKDQSPTSIPGVYAQYGVNLASFTFGGQTAALEIGGSLHPSGGMLWQYDGVKMREHGFNFWPEDVAGTINQSGGGLATGQIYYYEVCYEWTDAAGQLHRSAPSVPLKVDTSATLPVGSGSATVQNTAIAPSQPGLIAIGDTTVKLSNVTNFRIGQTIRDATDTYVLAAGTKITAINTGTNTITFTPAAVGDSATQNNVIVTTTNSYTATFASGSTALTFNSVAGLGIGQIITDLTTSASIQPNSRIVSIVGNVVTLSLPTLAASATSPGDVVATGDILSVTLHIPTLRQTYKTDNKVRLVVYRWSTANQIYYQASNTNSLTSPNPLTLNDTTVDSLDFADVLNDQAIIGNNIIYTTGGVIENICAPAASAMVLWQSRLFMADAEDPNLIWYSKQVIEATPVEMSDLLTLYVAPTTGSQGSTGPITALAAMDNNLIVFKKDALYYINGQGPDNTGAGGTFSDPVYITSSVGCINPYSVTLTPVGVMFQSDKGIWLLGRDLTTTYIGAEVEDYTTDVLVTSAITVPGTNQVRFTLDNKTALMYDYYFKLWGNWSNIAALSAVIVDDLHTYLSDYGQIVQETPGQYLDVSTPVLIDFTTGWFNLAGLQGFERFYEMNLLGEYISPHKLVVEISYDYNPGISQTIMISPINYTAPYGSDPIYGDNTYGGVSNVEDWRVFPERQKCSAFKITIKEVFDATLGTVAGAGLTLSGLSLVIGIKRGNRTNSANTSTG